MEMNKITNKKTLFVAAILIVFAFENCHTKFGNNESQKVILDSLSNCDTIYKGKRVFTQELPKLIIDSSFYPFLDSIVNIELNCPYYQRCRSGFSFFTEVYSNYYRIEVNSENINTYDYAKCFGFFEYKNHRFICEGIFNKEFLRISKSRVKVKYFDFDKYKKSAEYYDRISCWFFDYKNHKIIPKGYHSCSNE